MTLRTLFLIIAVVLTWAALTGIAFQFTFSLGLLTAVATAGLGVVVIASIFNR